MLVYKEEAEAVKSFEEIALMHLDEMYQAATSMLNSDWAAKDIVSAAFLQARRTYSKAGSGGGCRVWMFRTLFNLIRRHNYRGRWIRLLAAIGEMLQLRRDHAEVKSAEYGDVLSAFGRLPLHYREVLLLSDVYDLTCEEVQQALDIDVATLTGRLSEARRLMRARLEDEAYATERESRAVQRV